jgi:hypothetical protein
MHPSLGSFQHQKPVVVKEEQKLGFLVSAWICLCAVVVATAPANGVLQYSTRNFSQPTAARLQVRTCVQVWLLSTLPALESEAANVLPCCDVVAPHCCLDIVIRQRLHACTVRWPFLPTEPIPSTVLVCLPHSHLTQGSSLFGGVPAADSHNAALPKPKGKGPAALSTGGEGGPSFAARRKAALKKKKGPSLAEKRKALMAVPDLSVGTNFLRVLLPRSALSRSRCYS